VGGVAESDVARTNAEGKTSSVHFIHFPFNERQIAAFRKDGAQIVFAVNHPNYHHLAVLPEPVRAALAEDFAPRV
jgi:hypothetical protein